MGLLSGFKNLILWGNINGESGALESMGLGGSGIVQSSLSGEDSETLVSGVPMRDRGGEIVYGNATVSNRPGENETIKTYPTKSKNNSVSYDISDSDDGDISYEGWVNPENILYYFDEKTKTYKVATYYSIKDDPDNVEHFTKLYYKKGGTYVPSVSYDQARAQGLINPGAQRDLNNPDQAVDNTRSLLYKSQRGVENANEIIAESDNKEVLVGEPEIKLSESNMKIDVLFDDTTKNSTKNSTTNSTVINTPKMEYTKKVSLNVAPISKLNVSNKMSPGAWDNRIKYILGVPSRNIEYPLTSSSMLYNAFAKDWGLVFPYTPKISYNYKVNYEKTEILHSNLAVNHYKNSPPPTITLNADFTADGKDNAFYMYCALHFFRALSKCEFGEGYKNGNKIENKFRGFPPPVLYLNGCGNLITNTPVVITQFSIDLPKDKHYVHLTENMYNINVWLPTQMTFQITLEIQPNLNTYKNLFNLEEYKKNVMIGKEGENNNIYIINKNEYSFKEATIQTTTTEKGSITYYYKKDGDTYKRVERYENDNIESIKTLLGNVEEKNVEEKNIGMGWTW